MQVGLHAQVLLPKNKRDEKNEFDSARKTRSQRYGMFYLWRLHVSFLNGFIAAQAQNITAWLLAL